MQWERKKSNVNNTFCILCYYYYNFLYSAYIIYLHVLSISDESEGDVDDSVTVTFELS